MRIEPRITRAGVAAILVTAFSFSVWAVSSVLSAAPEHRIQYVPDDAFYYLTLARNFAAHGRWTFDSGTSVTTGFHPLYAYTLALVYRLSHPAPEQFLRLSILISYLPVIPTFLLATGLARRARNLAPALLLFLFMLSRNVALNGVSGVEWGFVVLLSSLYCALFGQRSESPRRGVGWLLFGCGLLGSLARSDFGLLPAALVLAAWIVRLLANERRQLTLALAGLGGAVSGVALIGVHNLLVGGDLQQSSAKMKLLWVDTYGPSADPISRMAISLLGTRSNYLAFAAIAVLACVALTLGLRTLFAERPPGDTTSPPVAEWSAGGEVDSASRVLWLGCSIAVPSYVFFYALNPAALQNWYTGNLVVPMFLAIALPLLRIEPKRALAVTAMLLLIFLGARQVSFATSLFRKPEWPHQVFMYRAGQYLRDPAFARGVGSWNAGIIGYYQGGTIVNIDGLVNNDIYSYARRNDLPGYIDGKSIGYIVDFEIMVSGAKYRRRGGYDRPDFLARLDPVKVFGGVPAAANDLTLYRVLSRK